MTRIITLSLLAVSAFALPAHASQMRTRAGNYELQVLSDGRPTRSFWHDGENWVLGQLGERYTLRVLNHSGRNIEAVISVDGRDVVDGQPGDLQKRGYLVPAYGSVDIDGWRISREQAAAFRFSGVGNSYAARMGSGREVGVIGVAVFEQRTPPVVYAPPRPYNAYPMCCATDGRERAMDKADNQDQQWAQSNADAPSLAPPAPPPPAATTPAPMDASGGPASGYHAEERAAPAKKSARLGLGTEYGEAVSSSITETTFERASSRPAAVIGCRYNDRAGLIALGIDVDGLSEAVVRRTADPFPVVDRGFAPPPAGWRE